MSQRSLIVIAALSLTYAVFVGLASLEHAKARVDLRHQQLERTLDAINERED